MDEIKTKYLKGSEMNNEDITKVATALRNGNLVVFPTDTVYGIGTNAYDEKACQKIYEVKGRPSYKPLIVLISDIGMLKKIVNQISPLEQKLIDTFWPGPLTIKFKKKKGTLPEIISCKDDYVRVRLIGSGITSKIIKEAGVPIVAPSANLSGNPTGTKIKNIISELGGKVDYILDFGDNKSDTPSTIIEVVNDKVVIIREGKIKREELAKVAFLDIEKSM